jgi:IS5 family transposase
MRPKEPRDSGQHDLLRARLDQIIDTGHALAKLARMIDWDFLSERLEHFPIILICNRP